MIQLNILSGKKAGANRRPAVFLSASGARREMNCNWKTTASGTGTLHWNFKKGTGFNLATSANALATVNGEPVLEKILRNGDIITVGSVKLQFWLAAAQQRGLRLRENFVWALLVFVTLGQFILIYWLIR